MREFLFLILALLPFQVAAENYGPYKAQYIRAIDGDTVEVLLHIFPGQTVMTRIRERTVDTPEKRSKYKCEKLLANEAEAITDKHLRGADEIKVDDLSLGTFAGRHVGTIWVDGIRLGDILIAHYAAVPYAQRKDKPWCRDN